MLEVSALEASYGSSQVLFCVDLAVRSGQVVSILGRNGMGKTTTVSTIMGLVRARAGRVVFQGQEIQGKRADEISRAGMGWVPEGRRVFSNLTVLENLKATAADRRRATTPWTVERVFDLFPSLSNRSENLGAQLSGGEQQMLAIGRALMTNPSLLLLDEATEGLSPLVRAEIWHTLVHLKATGLAILLIDKNVRAIARIADTHYILDRGRTVWNGDSQALLSNPRLMSEHLGV